jgi:hypothetical protein
LDIARQIAAYLLDETTNWEDWAQLYPGNVMMDGMGLEEMIQGCRICLSRYPNLVIGGHSQFAAKLGPLFSRVYTELRNGRGGDNPAHVLKQFLLWNDKNLVHDESIRQTLKATVCHNIQNAYEHPVWAEDGSWGFNPYSTNSHIEQAFSFWEYYLLGGGTLDEFLELARPGTGWWGGKHEASRAG